jgi:hypothetical protein
MDRVTTATADPVANAFEAALAKDAGRAASPPPDIPPPPPVDPDAPHGRDAEGTPLAPYGHHKQTGRPNKKPPGPGRPKTATAPAAGGRAAGMSSPPGSPSTGGEDYAGDLKDLADGIWMGASGLKGGRLGPVRVPDLRAHALAWHQSTPQLVGAWAAAADKNPTVRGYVRKLSGEGSWSWIIGVAISAAGLAAGLAAVSSATAEDRAQLAAHNDKLSEAFVREQTRALGMEIPE